MVISYLLKNELHPLLERKIVRIRNQLIQILFLNNIVYLWRTLCYTIFCTFFLTIFTFFSLIFCYFSKIKLRLIILFYINLNIYFNQFTIRNVIFNDVNTFRFKHYFNYNLICYIDNHCSICSISFYLIVPGKCVLNKFRCILSKYINNKCVSIHF